MTKPVFRREIGAQRDPTLVDYRDSPRRMDLRQQKPNRIRDHRVT